MEKYIKVVRGVVIKFVDSYMASLVALPDSTNYRLCTLVEHLTVLLGYINLFLIQSQGIKKGRSYQNCMDTCLSGLIL